MNSKDISYQSGFGNRFESEVFPEILPKKQNNPQTLVVKHEGNDVNLYAEQLSGTAFVTKRGDSRRTWLYRKTPSVKRNAVQLTKEDAGTTHWVGLVPEPLRWSPSSFPIGSGSFISSLRRIAANYSSNVGNNSFAIYTYDANKDMDRESFCNTDGDFLIIPYDGDLNIQTEMGNVKVAPHEIFVCPRGIHFSVCRDGSERISGFVLEMFEGSLSLPDRGPIGANSLADERHFLYPIAAVVTEDTEDWNLITKWMGERYHRITSCPYDVYAWHGNYLPYKYNLDNFCPVNTVSFDHADPSVFTVLTCKDVLGRTILDFVVFPERWQTTEGTFRPPYYHRNIMSEFMGVISGTYEGKKENFSKGAFSIHNRMVAHGPDDETTKRATSCDTSVPQKIATGLSFMIETSEPIGYSSDIYELRDKDYCRVFQRFA